MWTYLAGPFLAFLPARWKRAHLGELPVNWGIATLISGILEAIAAIVALVAWYSVFVTGAGPAIWKYFPWPYAGEIGLLSFCMHPLTWVIGYFAGEGVVRMLSGLIAGEAPGSLPLVMIDRIMLRGKEGSKNTIPPLAKDKVIRGGPSWDLKIASCRPKEHWKYPLTIRYQGEFFRVQGEMPEDASPERPHVYQLVRLPSNEIIRGLEEYDPEAVLHEERVPGFFATVAGEVRKKWS